MEDEASGFIPEGAGITPKFGPYSITRDLIDVHGTWEMLLI